MPQPDTHQLVEFLKTRSDRFKTVYRPVICPFEDLLELVPEGAHVFDVGCGAGTFLSLVAEFKRPAAIMGVDIDRGAIAQARELLASYASRMSVDVAEYDGGSLPDSLATADVVLMIDVLHHVPRSKKNEFVAEIAKKLRPGALFILKDMDAADRFWVLFNKLHDLLSAGEIGSELSLAQAEKIAREKGLSVESSSKRRMYVYSHYTLACRK